MKYKVLIYGHPALRQKALPVAAISKEIVRLADDLVRTMRQARGLGLAAAQIGRREAMCVIDIPPELDVPANGGHRDNPGVSMPIVLINPRLECSSGSQTAQEGCLSFPEIFVAIERPYEVTVSYIDLNGRASQVVGRGLLARAILHEMDHLDGVLLVDRMSAVQKIINAQKLKSLKKTERQKITKRTAGPAKDRH